MNFDDAKFLNEGCSCITVDKNLLHTQLEKVLGSETEVKDLIEARPNLFSSTTVFLSSKNYQEMKDLITAIENVISDPAYQKKVLERSPGIAQKCSPPKGVFMGYDFHLQEDGPKLIEINTNAGGALLNLELAKAQENCCQPNEAFTAAATEISNLEKSIIEMFLQEWSLQKGAKPLGLIAIVDEEPEKQYLYPEFLLFQKLFTKFNITSVIADPKELSWKEGKLWFKNQVVDFIYNRLTDFYLEQDTHTAIRLAYESGEVVVSPSPHHHALYANKLNLVTLTEKEFSTPALLKGIPQTQEVTPANADAFWPKKKNFFFKPLSGYGSKATYRGDKLTKRVWEEITKGGYIAQELVSPGRRVVNVDGKKTDLKLDIRAYVYEGKIQLLAARLYSGQTTNFRTAGGGFAPVFVLS